jgi:hypothetical protein
MIVPISENSVVYAADVRRELRAVGLHADVDSSDRKMQKKVCRCALRGRSRVAVLREKGMRPGEGKGEGACCNGRSPSCRPLACFDFDGLHGRSAVLNSPCRAPSITLA